MEGGGGNRHFVRILPSKQDSQLNIAIRQHNKPSFLHQPYYPTTPLTNGLRTTKIHMVLEKRGGMRANGSSSQGG